MKYRFFITTLTACIASSAMPFASAADSIQNAIGASKHAIQAVTMGIAASGQVTLGIVAVPMLSVGAVTSAVGGGSKAAGQASAGVADLPANGPLPITDKTITVVSPAEALKSNPATTPR